MNANGPETCQTGFAVMVEMAKAFVRPRPPDVVLPSFQARVIIIIASGN